MFSMQSVSENLFFFSHILVVVCSFFEFWTVSKWCIREWVKHYIISQSDTPRVVLCYTYLSAFFLSVSCTALSVPQGGNVSLETNGLTTTAQYMCDNGYSLVGSMTLTCRSDGSWDLTESSCGMDSFSQLN